VFINLESKPEWFLTLNPKGTVPTLEFDDGDMLTESLIVCDYLNDKYPSRSRVSCESAGLRPLYSHDALSKAKDRLLIERFGEVREITNRLIAILILL
jgi:glutathione S-transferase